MNPGLNDILSYGISVLILTSAIMAFKTNEGQNTGVRFLKYFLVFALIMQITSSYMAQTSKNNLWLFPFYTLGEYVLFHGFFFNSYSYKSNNHRYVMHTILILVALFIVIDSIIIHSFNAFISTAKVTECIVIVGYSIAFYIQQLRNLSIENVERKTTDALILLNSSIFIFFSGQFMIFLFSNYIVEWSSGSSHQLTWVFNSMLNIFFYSTILLGLWKLASAQKKQFG